MIINVLILIGEDSVVITRMLSRSHRHIHLCPVMSDGVVLAVANGINIFVISKCGLCILCTSLARQNQILCDLWPEKITRALNFDDLIQRSVFLFPI